MTWVRYVFIINAYRYENASVLDLRDVARRQTFNVEVRYTHGHASAPDDFTIVYAELESGSIKPIPTCHP